MNRRRVVGLGLLSCGAGVLTNAVPAYFILCLLKVPPGTAIRPMVEAFMIFVGAVGGLVVGVPPGLQCIRCGRRWWVGWALGALGIVLSCSPWFASGMLMDWVVAKQGFIMKP